MIPGSRPTTLAGSPTDDGTTTCECPRCIARLIDAGWLTSNPAKTQLRSGVIDPAALLGWADLERLASDPRTTTNTRLRSDRHHHTSRNTLLEKLTTGSTVQIQNCERADPTIAFLCAELQRLAFATTVGCNAYVSPDSGMPGLKPHRDNTYTTIVQLDGSKAWTVWAATPGPTHELLEECTWDPADDAGAEVIVDTVLKPGDVLQIALGDPHIALCRSAPSVHLTFAHRPLRSADVFEMALGHADQKSELSRDWCPTTVPSEIDRWVEANLTSFGAFIADLRSDPQLEALLEAVLIGRRLDDDGSLRDLAQADNQLLTGLGALASKGRPIDPSVLVGALPKLITLPPARLAAEAATTPERAMICEAVLSAAHSAILIGDLTDVFAPAPLPVSDLWALSEEHYLYMTTSGNPTC